MERLDKVLAHQGFGTRNDVKKLLRSATVTINGTRVTDPSAHIDMLHDVLAVDGETVLLQRNVYIMMNKCADVVCANKDGEHRTVFDLLDDSLRHRFLGGDLHTMGRLDLDTEGLLLLTTDGALTHRLISPKTHVPKTYAVRLRDTVDTAARIDYVRRFAEGLHIPREGNENGFDAQGAALVWLAPQSGSGDGAGASLDAAVSDSHAGVRPDAISSAALQNASGCDCLLTIYEGKFHQVKRMFAAVGNEVVYLKRVSMGALQLDPALPVGSYRELTDAEIETLLH